MYRDQVTTFTTAFEQHRVFFGLRIPYLYEQLGVLVHRCCQLQRLDKRAEARQLLDEELFKLFGVTAKCCDDRPLSVLAGLMRHILISRVRMQQPIAVTNEACCLVERISTKLGAAQPGATQGSNTILLLLDAQLHNLSQWLPEHVSLLEMHYFARLGLRDTARELEVAVDSIRHELRFARASLMRACRS